MNLHIDLYPALLPIKRVGSGHYEVHKVFLPNIARGKSIDGYIANGLMPEDPMEVLQLHDKLAQLLPGHSTPTTVAEWNDVRDYIRRQEKKKQGGKA